jgi:uncharacterized phage protein (TIGR01671 family)
MYKQLKYKVLCAELVDGKAVWNEKPVTQILLGDMGIEKVIVAEGEQPIIIDEISNFALESTTMFDKNGVLMFGGYLVKFPWEVNDSDEVQELIAPIVFLNGAFCLAPEGKDAIVYLSQQNVRQMEVIGNIYQHGNLIETAIDEKIFEKNIEEIVNDEVKPENAEEIVDALTGNTDETAQ